MWSNLNKISAASKHNKRNCISKIIDKDCTLTSSTDISNCLNNYFCTVGVKLSSNIKCNEDEFVKYCNKSIPNSMFCNEVGPDEILKIVSNFRNGKSPGSDHIGPKLLKSCLSELILPLLYIFNLSFSTGTLPNMLKIAKVIPVHKKGVTTSANNYRPISLLSIFEKILEKLMYKRVYSFLSKHSVLYNYQFGFRKNHSTVLALIELTDSIYKHLDEGDYILGMYFDLQKAFDTVDHKILLKKLYNYGLRGVVYKWFDDYLTNRQQYVSIGKVASSLNRVTCGVPQGSVLGPLLFLLYVNDICNAVPGSHVKLFADDTNLFVFGSGLDKLFIDANNSLTLLNDWFRCNKLSLNVDKTNYSVFSKSGCDVNRHNIVVDGNPLSNVTCVKYLGMFIDNHLTWSQHIQLIHDKLIKFTSIFYKVRNYMLTDVLKNLYYAFVYPHVLYGIELYANTHASYLSKLNSLNNKILRILQNKSRKCGTICLYNKYNVLPICKLHQFQLLCLVHKSVYHSSRLPVVFNNYFTANYSIHDYNTRFKNNLYVSCVQSESGKKAVKFKASQLWNKLPVCVKQIVSIPIFKRELKSFLFRNDI